MKTTNAKDAGSLHVGNNPLNIQKGDVIQISGEQKTRTVTYVMGSVAKSNVHLCMKGSGPVPLGEVEYDRSGAVQAQVGNIRTFTKDELQALLVAQVAQEERQSTNGVEDEHTETPIN